MSKFFKALEAAERERRLDPDPEASTPASPRPDPPARPEPVPPAPPAPRATKPERAPAPPPARPAPAAVPTATAVVEAPAPPAPVEPPPVPPRPAGVTEPLAAPAYGAPLARAARTHRDAFPSLLEPPPSEPSEVDDHLVSLLEPTGYAAEQYRSVRLHIETARRERDVHVVAISSPARGDGKTVTAINLAGALAQAPDARVALVEMDLRHPRMAHYLGLPAARGLSGYLLDTAMDADAVVERPSGIGFAVVPAGPPSSMPYELLKAPRLRALLAALRERFDFVVVDTPPVHPFPDVGILRDVVDAFVLVVRANQTPRELVRDSVQVIGAPRVLGLIFNDDERTAGFTAHGNGAGWRGYLGRPRGGARAA
jgi:capsular exopolysaccharide synthesis family protein